MFARGLFLAGVSLAAVAPLRVSAAVIDGVMIDDFFSTQDVSVSAGPPAFTLPQSSFDSAAAGSAVGGNRDILVTKTSGDDGEVIRVRTNPFGSNLLRMTQAETTGIVEVSWDGADSLPRIDVTGLGGIDLTAGLVDPFFEIKLTFSNVGGPLSLAIYQQGSSTNYAYTSLSVPGGVPSGSSVLLSEAFSNFTLFGTVSLNDIFTNAGAVVMTIDASAPAQEGWDMRLDYIKTRGTEPSASVALPGSLALSMLGLVMLRRRVAS